MKYCMHCGQKLRDESKFCYRCGRPCAAAEVDDVQEEFEGYEETGEIDDAGELYEAEDAGDFDGEGFDETGDAGDFGGEGFDEAEETGDGEESAGEEPADVRFADADEVLTDAEALENEETAVKDDLEDENLADEAGFGDGASADEAGFEDEASTDEESFEDEELTDEEDFEEEDLAEADDLEDVEEPLTRGRAISRKRYLEAVMEESGESLYEEDDDDDEPRRRRRRKKHGTAKFIVGIAVLALLMGYIFWSPARRAYLYAYSGDLESAQSVYRSEVSARPFERIVLQLLLPSGLDHVFNSYNRGGIAYEDAEARLKTFDLFDLTGSTAARKLNQLKTLQASKQAFAAAENAKNAGDVKQAMLSYRKVVREDTNYEAAREQGDACEAAYKTQILSLAGTPETDEEYRNAIAVLTEAVQALPSDMELSDKLTTLKQKFAADLKARAVPAANDYIEQGQYKEAVDILSEALEFNQQDDDLLSLKNTAINRYEDFVKSQVSIYLGNKDVRGALELLERAMGDLPDNQVFAQLYSSVRTES